MNPSSEDLIEIARLAKKHPDLDVKSIFKLDVRRQTPSRRAPSVAAHPRSRHLWSHPR